MAASGNGGRIREEHIEYRHTLLPNRKLAEKVARFRQVNMDNPNTRQGPSRKKNSKKRKTLGNALSNLGGRENGTAKLEEAAAAYREALKEQTRERVPLQWAGAQNNLGNALWRLGERENV